jgi:phosphate starvation-inducible protein PhoH
MGKAMERIVNAERVEDLIAVFGSFDENVKRIEEALDVRVVNRGTDLRSPVMRRWWIRLSAPWKDS